jgi:hypothetical protein
MKKLWLALLFFAGGVAHEIRNPVSCHCISSRHAAGPKTRRRHRSGAQSTASTDDANT